MKMMMTIKNKAKKSANRSPIQDYAASLRLTSMKRKTQGRVNYGHFFHNIVIVGRPGNYRPADGFSGLPGKRGKSSRNSHSSPQSIGTNTTKDRELLKTQLKLIENLQRLPKGWDGYNAESPNQNSVIRSQFILMHLFRMKFLPDKITPSVENGVGISFIQGDKYADIECFNTGEILAVTSDRQAAPQVWEVSNRPQEITSALRKIRDFISR
jgi:hypothetical protein